MATRKIGEKERASSHLSARKYMQRLKTAGFLNKKYWLLPEEAAQVDTFVAGLRGGKKLSEILANLESPQ
ncbi:MAG: hypothetical protein AAF975_07700 [Spirochaetota bacterium]